MAERIRCSPVACAYSLRLHSAQIWYERTRLGLGRSRDDCQIGPPLTLVFCPSRFRTVEWSCLVLNLPLGLAITPLVERGVRVALVGVGLC